MLDGRSHTTGKANSKCMMIPMIIVLGGSIFCVRAISSRAANFTDQEFVLLKKVASWEKCSESHTFAVTDSVSDLQVLYDTLSGLASLYCQNGRWDEYSEMRSRMLDIYVKVNPDWSPPLPGGPFCRIGLSSYRSEKMIPRSFLSRWLNKKTLPKLYADNQISFDEYRKIYQNDLAAAEKNREPAKIAASLEGLADLYCAEAKFVRAESLCLRALSVRSETFGPKNNSLSKSLLNLAAVYRIENRGVEAEQLDQRANALSAK